MKIFNTVWSVLCVIWMLPLIVVSYIGMFVYSCYLAIRYKDVEYITIVNNSLLKTLDRGCTIIKENMEG